MGQSDILTIAGVQEIISDLPGVGENYQDHHLLVYPYHSSLMENETMDAITCGRVNVDRLIQDKAPILGWNAMDIVCKIRPSDVEIAALGPTFQEFWDKEYKADPNKPLALGSLINA